MQIRNKKIERALLLFLCFGLLLSGCGKESETKNKEQEETRIPVTFLVNPDTGENENEELVQSFNEAYEGTYQLEVTWMTDTAEGYRARIKTLNGLDKLPAIITDAGFDADFYDLLIRNNRLTDIRPYIEADKQWEDAYGEREFSVYQEADGGIYLAPSGNASLSYAGFYYNKDLFRAADIQEFPTDWEDFFACLDTLKAKGITPLAIHGGSSYWTSLLMAAGYTAGTKEGLDFLETQYPKDYKIPGAADMFAMLKRLYEYTDADALHIERPESAKRFVQQQAAITANGGWMLLNFTEEQSERIGFAAFPGGVLMEDMKMSAWAVTAGYPEEVIRGAAEFLKFRALLDAKQEAEYFDTEGENMAEREYKQAVRKAQRIMPNYQLKWEAGIQEEFLVNALPLYVEGEISQEEFLNQLNEAVQVIEEEK